MSVTSKTTAAPAGSANAPATERNAVDVGKELFKQLRDADGSALHKRQSKQAAPVGVGLGVAGLALLGTTMNPAAGLVFGPLSIAALTAGLYVPKILRTDLLGVMGKWAREHPVHTWISASAAIVWYFTAIILGYGAAPLLAITGYLGLLLLSARWWQHWRIGYPAPPVVPVDDPQLVEGEGVDSPEIVEDEIEVDEVVEKWALRVAANGGVLPGSRLSDREDVPAGAAYTLRVVPGRHTVEDVLNVLPKLGSALGVPARNLLVEERPPTADEPEPDPAILRFQVITKSPIRETVPLTGPRWRMDGRNTVIDLGPFADGVGQAPWRVFTENSFWGGFVVGTTGAGKSALLDSMAISLMDTGLVTIIYVDPQAGASSPALFDHADWSIGNNPDQWENLLLGLEDLVNFRSKEQSVRLKVSGFTPSTRRPAVCVIIDECHMVFNPGNAKRWGTVARVGRKNGVGIVAASQIYGLDSFGGDDALRQSIEAANSAILRVGRNQASLIPGTTLNPSLLPAIPGYGVVRAVDPLYNRTAPFRGPYAPDETRYALMGAAARKQPRLDSIAVGSLDNRTDEAYTRRHDILSASLEAMEEELRALEAGMTVDVPDTTKDVGLPVGPQFKDFLDEVTAYTQTPEGHGLTGVKKILFEAVEAGIYDTKSLRNKAAEFGFTAESWVFDALRDLVRDGLIAKGTKQGTYEKAKAS